MKEVLLGKLTNDSFESAEILFYFEFKKNNSELLYSYYECKICSSANKNNVIGKILSK